MTTTINTYDNERLDGLQRQSRKVVHLPVAIVQQHLPGRGPQLRLVIRHGDREYHFPAELNYLFAIFMVATLVTWQDW